MTIDPGSPELKDKAENGGSILDGPMADLNTVFSSRALKDVDQELCFGMVCQSSFHLAPASWRETKSRLITLLIHAELDYWNIDVDLP